jgi:hypothetical protein
MLLASCQYVSTFDVAVLICGKACVRSSWFADSEAEEVRRLLHASWHHWQKMAIVVCPHISTLRCDEADFASDCAVTYKISFVLFRKKNNNVNRPSHPLLDDLLAILCTLPTGPRLPHNIQPISPVHFVTLLSTFHCLLNISSI